ncbi:MAG TPA: hypothetical protein VL501_10075 [Pyrinomonadaceae bacterium]|nr:hypothetical protein [Pyrinomonadaceae bacterium]
MKHKQQPTHTTQPDGRTAGGPPAIPSSTTTDEHAGSVPAADLAELRAENERLKKQLAEQSAHSSLKDKLKQAGARTPKLLLDAAKDALKFTVAGELENAVEIVEALREKFPEQFGTHTPPSVPSIDAGAGRVSKPGLTREALAKMTPAQVAELDWNDVRRALSTKN